MNLLSELLKSFNQLPVWVRIWVCLILVPVNLATLAFIGMPSASLIAGLAMAGLIFNSIPMYLERGFTNAMALPHVIFWLPLIFVLSFQLFFSQLELPSEYHYFLLLLLSCNSFSLVFDIPDSFRWIKLKRA